MVPGVSVMALAMIVASRPETVCSCTATTAVRMVEREVGSTTSLATATLVMISCQRNQITNQLAFSGRITNASSLVSRGGNTTIRADPSTNPVNTFGKVSSPHSRTHITVSHATIAKRASHDADLI